MTTEQKNARRRVTPFRIIVSSILLLIVMVFWALLVGGQIQAQEVISSSMAPTVTKGDRILVLSKDGTDEVKRGEIVMVAPAKDYELPLLKRVLGVPGDTISWIDHAIFVNEQPTRERFEEKGIPNAVAFNSLTLREDEYFVVGDNYGNSFDSTSFGAVTRDRILGRAVYRYAPFSKMGWLTDQ
ncbi:MAG: signal peptidase [Candidatus Sumerlaeota bacterium]|nr:signal peptidase [Candidatus Sumerlaeota bacterium]